LKKLLAVIAVVLLIYSVGHVAGLWGASDFGRIIFHAAPEITGSNSETWSNATDGTWDAGSAIIKTTGGLEVGGSKSGIDTIASGATEDTVVISGITASWKPFITWNGTSADSSDPVAAKCAAGTLFVGVQSSRGVARAYNYIVIK